MVRVGFAILLLLISILLIVLGSTWQTKTEVLFMKVSYSDLSLLLSALGTSLFSALAIYVSLQFLSERLLEKKTMEIIEAVKQDLFKSIYGRYISPSLFFEVERCLLKNDLMRRNTNLLLEITDEAPNCISECEAKKIQDLDLKDYLFCVQSITYELENTSATKVAAPIKSVIELPLDKELSEVVKTLNLTIDEKPVPKEDISTFNDIRRDSCVTNHEIDLEPGRIIKVKVESLLLKKSSDVETWASVYPTENLNLTVVHGVNYEVNASANHADNLQQTHNTGNMKQWVLNKGIFPYQSVVVWWHKVR